FTWCAPRRVEKVLRPEGLSYSNENLVQRLDADFLEKDNVVVAVILQAHIALVGARAALRFEIIFVFGDGLALGVIGDGDIIENDDGARAVEGDDHGVPLGAGLAGFGQRLGERVERAGDVVLVFFRIFGMIVDLHFVAVVDGHPFLARLDGDANEDAGVVVDVAHFVDQADPAVAELATGPVEQAHAAWRSNEAVLDGHVARADVFPAGEVFAIEQRLPGRNLRRSSRKESEERGKGNDCKRRDPFSWIHGEFLLTRSSQAGAPATAGCAPTIQNFKSRRYV